MQQQLPIQISNGHYELRQHIGAGAFGEVYLARDLFQPRDVAVKLFQPWVQLDQVLIEADLHTRLSDHPNVVDIFNVGFDAPGAFMVTRYLPGGTAEDRIAADLVTVVEAVRWTREILRALAFAHSLDVLHRDLRAANLLFNPDNDEAMLADFGIGEDSVRRQFRHMAYGPNAAPEWMDNQTSSELTDLWSLGCVLYKLLTGRQPFGPNPSRKDIKASGPPATVRSLKPQVPQRVVNVVLKALQVDPALRFQSATEMLEALRACSVRCSWQQVPGQNNSWTADTEDGRLQVDITQNRKRGMELVVRRDLGSGLRRVQWPLRFPTLGAAQVEVGKIMRAVVEVGHW